MILKAETDTGFPVFYMTAATLVILTTIIAISFTAFEIWLAFDGWDKLWYSTFLFGEPNAWDFFLKFFGLPIVLICNWVMFIPIMLVGEAISLPYTFRICDDDEYFTRWFVKKFPQMLENNDTKKLIKIREIKREICRLFDIDEPKNTDYGFGHWYLRRRCLKNKDLLDFGLLL